MRQKAFSFMQSRYRAACCLEQVMMTRDAQLLNRYMHSQLGPHFLALGEEKTFANQWYRMLLLTKAAMFAVDIVP